MHSLLDSKEESKHDNPNKGSHELVSDQETFLYGTIPKVIGTQIQRLKKKTKKTEGKKKEKKEPD